MLCGVGVFVCVLCNNINLIVSLIVIAGLVHLDIRPANIFLTYNEKLTTIQLKKSESTTNSNNNTHSNTLSQDNITQHNNTNTNAYITLRNEVEEKLATGRYLMKLGDFGHCRGVEKNNNDVLIEGMCVFVLGVVCLICGVSYMGIGVFALIVIRIMSVVLLCGHVYWCLIW